MKLGKFKKSLDDNCNECGDRLQLRTISEDYVSRGIVLKTINTDHVVCMNCGEMRESKTAKKSLNKRISSDKDINWE